MKVIELGQLKEVPDDYRCCSICGIYNSLSSFNDDGLNKPSRTNCDSCYRTDPKNWEELKKAKNNAKNSKEAELYLKEKFIENCSISVEDLIKRLKNLPKGSKIVMTQDGYYADGKFAEILEPKLVEGFEELKVFTIGHSSQNY